MKHLSYLFLGLAGLALASCSQEDLMNPSVNPDGTANITLNLSTPGIGTRYSEGTGATKLQYAVYEVTKANGEETLRYVEGLSKVDDGNGNDNSDYISLNKQLTMKLVTDHDYRLVFWAGHPENTAYSIKWNENAAPVMTVDYSKVKANDETLDGFFKSVDLTVNGDVTMSVELKRPFAQINVGTSDYEASKLSGCEPDFSNITVSTCYNSLNLMTGQVEKDLNNSKTKYVDNNIAGRPSATASATAQSFPVPGHDYLAMAYVLVPMYDEDLENKDKTMNEVVEVYFGYNDQTNLNEASDKHNRTVGSVPLKRNYRTNIYGDILTGTANLNVEIVPAYDGELRPNALDEIAGVGGLLQLTEDLELDHSIEINTDVIIDLNDNNITYDSSNNNFHAITIGENGNLLVKGNGKVSTSDYAPFFVNGGTLTIQSGTYTSDEHCEGILIGPKGGTVIIEGGYFAFKPWNGKYYTLNVEDKVLAAGNAKFIVKGGSFENFNPSASDVDMVNGKPADWVAEGYVSQKTKIDGKECYVVLKEGTTIVDSKNFATEIKKGGDLFLIEDVAVTSLSYNSSANVDLNGNTITSHQNGASGYKSDVTYSNGKIVFDQAKATNPMLLVAEANATLTLENMELELMNGCLSAEGENSEIKMINCKAKGNNQIISTNASKATNSTPKVKMYLENCEFSASTPILNNVPAIITVVNCTLDGGIQGALIRGGEATFIDCTINFHNNMDYNGSHNPFRKKWDTGNMCVMAAIAGGNLNTPNSYQYPTVINLEGNNVINISGNYADETPAIHLAANSGEGLGVSFNYNTTNLKINYPEGVTLKSNYKEIEYSTSNIKVNGSVVSPNVTL